MRQLKTLGLVGGMSHHSTLIYEREIHDGVMRALGGNWSADLLIRHLPFEPLKQMQENAQWDEIGEQLAKAAQALQAAGAQAIMITSNTMHRQAHQVETVLSVPFLHITDPTVNALRAQGFTKALLLGTRFTMEQNFIRDRLEQQGIAASIPDEQDRTEINRIIYDELCKGQFTQPATAFFQGVIEKGRAAGAQAVVLGCTEIGLIINAGNAALPVFDTTALHISKAIEFCLE